MARGEARPGFLTGRLRSVGFALSGIRAVLTTQPNAWIHALASLLVVGLGLGLGLGRYDWCWLLAAIALVWVAEALNTALEALADAAVPDHHPLVERAKDAAAAAVLVAALTAALIGLAILGPPLLARLAG